MSIRTVVSAFLLVFAMGCRDQALPEPISACSLNSDGLTQTCDLFEGTVETSGLVPLVNPVTSGFVVLREADLSWSDIVWFPDDAGGLADDVQLFSEPFNFSTLPFKEGDVTAGATFVPELSTDPTTIIVSTSGFDDTFRVFSQSAVQSGAVPEPSTLVLLFSALIGLGIANRKRASCAFIKGRMSAKARRASIPFLR